MPANDTCTNGSCFFCAMNEPKSSVRKAHIAKCFKEMPLEDDQEHVLALSCLWHTAMTQPDEPEFPSLGIFQCMAKLIDRGINDKDWLFRDQNIYIPYYAAHVIGSYTMNKSQFADIAIKSGVILPLLELLSGKISWVEQRVAVRALGHLASHESTFQQAVAEHEEEIINLAMEIASTCLDVVYNKFVMLKGSERLKYHCDLLTRGLGGLEIENKRAEEWASQLQCWSLYLLNCFASRERSINLICSKKDFLEDLCGMWGGLANCTSPAGLGLVRTLCNTKTGRKSVSNSKKVIESLCNLSRSADDWQYMAIECLLSLLKDPDTRYVVIDIAVLFLVDLVEIRSIGVRKKVGDCITQTLLQDYGKIKYGKLNLKSKRTQKALEEIWDLKVERRKRDKLLSTQKARERKNLVGVLKQEGNERFWSGDIEEAVVKYSKALDLCSLNMIKERTVLYSNRAQCYLLLREPELVISDATRALSLSSEASPHGKSLWRRSQAYDMKGLAKESLMDCLKFVNGQVNLEKTRHVKIPYYAVRLINKQMNATWLFAAAKSKRRDNQKEARKSISRYQSENVKRTVMEKDIIGMPTVVEEPLLKGQKGKQKENTGRRRKYVNLSARLRHVQLGEENV